MPRRVDEESASGNAVSHWLWSSGLKRKLGLAVAALLPLALRAAAPQVWFCPLDPLFRPEVNYGGSPQYMSLFNQSASWTQAASRVNVFKIYPQWIGSATDGDLQIQFADLNRRGIAIALEYGVLTSSSQCGTGVEGFGGQTLLNAALRIEQNGGTLRYVGMDEPIFFSTLYTGTNACKWTVDQMAANAAVNIRTLLTQFPNVIIGDIEPFPVTASIWLTQYQAGIEAFRKNLGFPLAFFDADVLWDTPSYLADLAAVRKMLASEGVPFGIIYNGNANDTSDAKWIQSATQHLLAVELNLGSPDLVIFQSWHAYPKKLLPETDSDSFTSIIDTYFRRRTTLSSFVSGTAIQGALTAADTGQPISNASINVTISPTSGSGVPGLYTLSGTIPSGTRSVVFGARVNLECNCSGTADFLVSSFTMDAGAAGTITRDFSNQLSGWGVSATGSPAGTAKIEGISLHVVAEPGQSVLLNSPPIPFTSSVPYAFRVGAQVSPKTSGSGYFTLIFLGASTEISRVQIPFAAASLPIGSATTDTLGRYTLPLPAIGLDLFQVQSAYDGSSDNWPALASVDFRGQLSIKNSASFALGSLAPDTIGFGEATGIAPSTIVAPDGPWPVNLGGVGLEITDSLNQTRFAPIYFVTTNAISYLIPDGTALGPATTKLTTSTGATIAGSFNVDHVSPGLFTANASGSGVAAGFWIRVAASGAQNYDYLFDSTKPVGNRVPIPVDLGVGGDQVFLSLYGTGFRSATQATATVDGDTVPVSGFASVAAYQGEDVVNIGPLPRSLAGRGNVGVVLTFDGKVANTVTVSIR